MVTITAGETFNVTVSADPAASVLVQFAGMQSPNVAATGTAGTFTASANTSGWIPGHYIWEAWATVAAHRALVGTGDLLIRESAATLAPGAEVRTQARIAVAHIQAMLAGGATLEAKRYKINNRELERHSIPELLQLLSFWRRELSRESRRDSASLALGSSIAVRI
jgi:hypothetical protein